MDIKIGLLKDKLLKNLSNKKLEIIYDIINRNNKVSLRILEWFVANYAKTHKVSYKLENKTFLVYNSYKDEQLNSYKKKLFDMYRRMDRVFIPIKKDKVLETTVAQLNFFTWIFKCKILEYIEKNIEKIKKDLSDSCKTKIPKRKKQDIVITRSSITINLC